MTVSGIDQLFGNFMLIFPRCNQEKNIILVFRSQILKFIDPTAIQTAHLSLIYKPRYMILADILKSTNSFPSCSVNEQFHTNLQFRQGRMRVPF